MFKVHESREAREQKIRDTIQSDPAVGVLLAAAHFEWLYRRALVSLSPQPNRDVRAALGDKHLGGMEGFKELWKVMVATNSDVRLPKVIPNWSQIHSAYKLRNKLIHGIYSCGQSYARDKAKVFLAAAVSLDQFCVKEGADVYKRLKIRKVNKKKGGEKRKENQQYTR